MPVLSYLHCDAFPGTASRDAPPVMQRPRAEHFFWSKDREILHNVGCDDKPPRHPENPSSASCSDRPWVPGERPRRTPRQRSISPMTMSNEPTMAGTSAIGTPVQISWMTERLEKQLLRALTRHGIEDSHR